MDLSWLGTSDDRLTGSWSSLIGDMFVTPAVTAAAADDLSSLTAAAAEEEEAAAAVEGSALGS